MTSLEELNQSLRTSILQHKNFHAMRASLSEPTCTIVDTLLAGDVAPSLIEAARESSPGEFRRYTFLRALEGGNPNPAVAVNLTNLVLDYLLAGLDEFWE